MNENRSNGVEQGAGRDAKHAQVRWGVAFAPIGTAQACAAQVFM